MCLSESTGSVGPGVCVWRLLLCVALNGSCRRCPCLRRACRFCVVLVVVVVGSHATKKSVHGGTNGRQIIQSARFPLGCIHLEANRAPERTRNQAFRPAAHDCVALIGEPQPGKFHGFSSFEAHSRGFADSVSSAPEPRFGSCRPPACVRLRVSFVFLLCCGDNEQKPGKLEGISCLALFSQLLRTDEIPHAGLTNRV